MGEHLNIVDQRTAKNARRAGKTRPDIEFYNVSMRYGSNGEVLKNVNFSLSNGSFHFLTGPSGAGKSTLLKLIYLALNPSRGQVKLFGFDPRELDYKQLPYLKRKIGVVFQEFRLLNHLSVLDNVALPLRITQQHPKNYMSDVVELLRWVGLGKHLHALPKTLSGGEQQRVAIARAVVAKPRLLLADEPTGNVDPDMADRLLRLFFQLNKFGTTILLATHDRGLIEKSGAPVLTIKDRQVIRQES